MNDVLINVLPVLAFGAHLVSFLAHILGRRAFGLVLTEFGFLLLACTVLINWSLVHRLPVYSQHETCVHTALVLRFLIDNQERVSESSVEQAEPEGVFEESALRAVHTWRFEPGEKDGRPLVIWVQVFIRLELSR